MLKITLVTLGNKMPSWVQQAIQDYSKRLQDSMNFSIIEIPLLRRGKSMDLSRMMEKEMKLMRDAIPPNAHVITLDRLGESFSSETLAEKISRLQHTHSHLCFLIGGPEGLSPKLITHSQERWSLSMLTLPHPLVRIVLIEALYRAWSILHHHPYHK